MLGWTFAEPNIPVTGEVNDDSGLLTSNARRGPVLGRRAQVPSPGTPTGAAFDTTRACRALS